MTRAYKVPIVIPGSCRITPTLYDTASLPLDLNESGITGNYLLQGPEFHSINMVQALLLCLLRTLHSPSVQQMMISTAVLRRWLVKVLTNLTMKWAILSASPTTPTPEFPLPQNQEISVPSAQITDSRHMYVGGSPDRYRNTVSKNWYKIKLNGGKKRLKL